MCGVASLELLCYLGRCEDPVPAPKGRGKDAPASPPASAQCARGGDVKRRQGTRAAAFTQPHLARNALRKSTRGPASNLWHDITGDSNNPHHHLPKPS